MPIGGSDRRRADARLLGWWPGHRLGSLGRQRAPTMLDRSHEALHGRFVLHGDDADHETAPDRSTERWLGASGTG